MTQALHSLPTPSLLLDVATFERNIARLDARLRARGNVLWRPHLKTAKSAAVAARILAGRAAKAAVSTLQEAEYFAACGIRDLLYTVPITPDKIARVARLTQRGIQLCVILDDLAMARTLTREGALLGVRVPVMLEVDCDAHRGGIDPASPELTQIADELAQGRGTIFRGVLTHAGASYSCTTSAQITALAADERSAAVKAATRIRSAGVACPQISVGSTPTAMFGDSFDDVTELRAGVYFFNDLTMAGLGVCSLADVALSVLTTVVGHQVRQRRLLLDAGWMALSADRSPASQRIFAGYGVLASVDGQLLPGLGVLDTNQEHGMVGRIDDQPIDFTDFPIGTRLRVLPNHACATAAAFDAYHALMPDGDVALWARCRGW
jgi:D-serine deaminase-like pyridoxal phosphate-dependent protein